jgi:hypothetical protein
VRRILASLACLLCAAGAHADEAAFEARAQTTYLRQLKPTMASPYSGANSLRGQRELSYTFTTTLFFATRIGDTELYFNPEAVQGAPLSALHGLGGFSNGEAQRGASGTLKAYQARLFARYAWNLGGEWEDQASDQNQVKTRYAAERVVLTAGNLSVLDVFDAIDYSRDARTQFMNWSSLTYGAWDYAADARGYTWGAAIEYISPSWQLRAGRFLVPVESNGMTLETAFLKRYGDVVEFERPYRVAGRPAIVRGLVFQNKVHAGSFGDAAAFDAGSGSPPDVTVVRRDQLKRGFGFGTQVELSENAGAYVRAGWSDGKTESFMFTEIDRSLAGGALLKGGLWGRADDKAGLAGYLNGLSRAHRAYLAAGGTGFFLGDGRLSYATERIVEAFYSVGLGKRLALSVGYQRIANPGYNRDRGPADILGLRLHAEM